MRTGLALLVLLSVVPPAWGQRRQLAWDFVRELTPPTKGFGIAAVGGNGSIQQFQVAPSEPGACDWAGAATEGRETFCTTVACPAAGSITAYWVQEVSDLGMSVPTNILTCWTPPHVPTCPCLDPGQAPPGQGLPPSLPPVMQPPASLPPLSTDPPPLPQRSAEGLHLQPIGPLPVLSSIPTIPPSAGT